jgi:hypothetical protein
MRGKALSWTKTIEIGGAQMMLVKTLTITLMQPPSKERDISGAVKQHSDDDVIAKLQNFAITFKL